MPSHPLTNLEIQKYYQNEPKFNGVYSRNNLPNKIEDGAYVINFDEYADVDSSVSVVGAPIGIAGPSFTIIFVLATLIIKKLLNITRNKKKKHDKILMLSKSKLNIIDILVSQALTDMD